MTRMLKSCFLAALVSLLAGCATVNSKGTIPLMPKEPWGVAPLVNSTETSYAAERATAILVALLRTRGISSLEVHQEQQRADDGIGRQQPPSSQELLEWAKQRKLRYILTGTVTEWRYKVGLDGEPAAGVTLQVVDVTSGTVVWSGAGAKSGWSREALSSVGQQVISKLLETISLVP